MPFPRSHSMSEKKTDEYGIGFASDSDEEGGPEHNSMPNLSRKLSRNVLSSQSSMARTASPDGGDASGGGGCGGTNLHIFFIWVDPSDPCADRLVEWPLPERYQTHVRRWEERYQVPLPSPLSIKRRVCDQPPHTPNNKRTHTHCQGSSGTSAAAASAGRTWPTGVDAYALTRRAACVHGPGVHGVTHTHPTPGRVCAFRYTHTHTMCALRYTHTHYCRAVMELVRTVCVGALQRARAHTHTHSVCVHSVCVCARHGVAWRGVLRSHLHTRIAS
jgi:hypothetical protein